MKKASSIKVVLTLFVTLPIWFYLLHEVLERVNASELMWFLFWIYIPAGIFVGVLAALADD